MTATSKIIAGICWGLAFAGLYWLRSVDAAPHDCLGTPESWSTSWPFSEHAQAEVLATGLDDVRGLACDKAGNVYLSEANGRVLRYSVGDKKLNEPELTPDQPEKVDQRGMAIGNYALVVAEHGLGHVEVREWVGLFPVAWALATTGSNNITGPSGIAILGTTLFVTDDRPWPDKGADVAFDTSDYTRWIDKGSQRLFGEVWECNVNRGQCAPVLVGSHLRHPSGIAAAGPAGPVFVAESDSKEVRWVVFEKNGAGQWFQASALGSAVSTGDVLPPFMGVAYNDVRSEVYAAGPNGLYVLSPQQGKLGRMLFEEPVTGIAYQADTIYLVSGHRLCLLKFGQQLKGTPCMARGNN